MATLIETIEIGDNNGLNMSEPTEYIMITPPLWLTYIRKSMNDISIKFAKFLTFALRGSLSKLDEICPAILLFL